MIKVLNAFGGEIEIISPDQENNVHSHYQQIELQGEVNINKRRKILNLSKVHKLSYYSIL
jgi:hypothetical protein